MITTNYIGQPVNRVDGRAKVTGQAKYAAEFNVVSGITYGFVVSSPVTKGKITAVNTRQALSQKGVLQVFTHENVSGLAWFDRSYKDQDAPKDGSPFRPFQNNEIQFSLQPIALVVAETYELARYAASLIHFEYEVDDQLVVGLEQNLDKARKPKSYKVPVTKPRGDANEAFEQSAIKHHGDYYHGSEHHNPMEMHATTVIYGDDDKLTIYDKTQGVQNSQSYVKKIFGLSDDQARVISPFVGGAFGSGLRPQYQLFMAVLASLELKRSVKVVLTRQQMFSFGHRPATLQKVIIGASADGKLQSIINKAYTETSQFEEYTENIVNWSGYLYHCENVDFDHQIVSQDVYTPLDMRAPGGVTGVYAIECAVDETAYKAGIDPLEFRMMNYAEKDLNDDLPFSSRELMQCYLQGAERFGWRKRNPEVRSMREGHNLIGWGVATGAWEAQQMPVRAKAKLSADGKLTVSTATSDIGTGTYTSMTQVAAETLGLPIEDVLFKLGDSAMPLAPLQGGSWTAASVGSAVKLVCEDIRSKLFSMARKVDNSPFANADTDDVIFDSGKIISKSNPQVYLTVSEIMHQSGVNVIEEDTTSLPNMLKQKQYSRYTHSAVFVEVKVDEDLGTVHVTRVVSAVAGGRIINPKTARSQVLGGVVWGISQALQEDTILDNNIGRFMNHDLAEYHIPVNADIKDIEVIFVEEHDDIVNPLGVKGLGEIGIVGVAAAISNAVYHATGKRVRDLPIQLNKLM
ncbi:xanthine dehydrogenase family protein molybdopterin-binding subunit [Mucilaginibacter sp. Bleaf8]|uniref:xanthine dehydrogenase family protein molybdopterin-binding subunit n=1 Tax=Mucilaginibacter sp. Bleaf8 TaxID=2834430 RepID=UPI001BCB1210|nr:xanthine dehydrogenase family protein molybdopterin-binding subunit [Mucilaginibacter sp. Bleaf8]MBS7566222.1 xanthine dehydrogenase family protein molybdopterin-binding subunit [Mucilaginibacter sp. Bleaf8]